MGYTYRDVKAVLAALNANAWEVHHNASYLNKKAMQFSSSSAEVVAARTAALDAYSQANEATTSLHRWGRVVNDFSKKVKDNFKEYFFGDGDNGFNDMFKTCQTYKNEFKHLLVMLEDLENSSDVQNWGREQKSKLEEISGEITPKLLNDHQQGSDFERLNRDFGYFISGTTIGITTVTVRLASAQNLLVEAQKLLLLPQ
ncbi:hypothetical protein ERJ75_000404000 [Trypanosoma vivax]|nr:hypothetical protein ERJ75_000404000 [Trypanosoma vivax]